MNDLKELELKVDAAVYPLAAIKAAAYGFTDRAWVRIGGSKGEKISIILKLKDRGNAQLDLLSDEFHNELLHQSLRLQISSSNQKIREYIVTKALVSAQAPGEPSLAPLPVPVADAGAACVECAPLAAPTVDSELEKEIEKLLAQIEKSDAPGADPLGVAVTWEKKYGGTDDKKAGGKKAGGKARDKAV